MKGNDVLDFESISDPKSLPQEIIAEMQSVSQDIWSRRGALGELCQCESCGKVYAAEDIFSMNDLQNNLVGTLIANKYGSDPIPCMDSLCGGMTSYIFGPKHVEDIRARYTTSVASFLVLCRDKATGKIVGMEDGYISSPSDAINREFQHYNTNPPGVLSEISYNWIDGIQSEVSRILGYAPQKILTLSSIGVLSQYQSPFVLFEILKRFAELLPTEGKLPGITEVDTRSPIHVLSQSGGAQQVDVPINHSRKQEYYNSSLVVYPDPIGVYKSSFTKGPREFIRLLRQSSK